MGAALKDKIHDMVNTIHDEETLNQVMEDIEFYTSRKNELNSLTETQLQELDIALKEADSNQVISFEDFRRELSEWKGQS